MTKYSFAQLDRWVAKTQRRTSAVLKQATNDMLRDVEIVPGISRGGSRKRGTIPRDLGALANSLQSSLQGTTSLSQSGQQSYVMVAGAFEGGDVATFTWGGGAAPHARAVHYGARGVPGTFWVDVAAGKWPGYVRSATTRAKAAIR